MGDSYQALLDLRAGPAEAVELAPRVVAWLVERGLVAPTPTPDCVLGEAGYPAGPLCAQHYQPGPKELAFWRLATSGVEVVAAPWVNLFGFTVFEQAVCPCCGHRQTASFLQQMLAFVEPFVEHSKQPDVLCEACEQTSGLHDWSAEPHPGFAQLTVVFWNWPPFDRAGWKLDVPTLLAEALGREFTSTFGLV